MVGRAAVSPTQPVAGPVTVVEGDTATVGHGVGTFASRAAVAAGSALVLAAREVRARTLALAARLLGAPESEIEQHGTAFGVIGHAKHVTLAQIAAAAAIPTPGHDPGLEVTRFFQPPASTYAHGAHVVEVEVDPSTAQVQILGYWVAHDCGRLINPLVVEGQIHGGLVMGLGNALTEEILYNEEGQPLATS